jgi:hypothetical protein
MMPGVDFMLLGHKRVTERDLKVMRNLIIGTVVVLLVLAAGLAAYAYL